MIADTELQMGSEVIWWTVVYILCILKFFFIIVFKFLVSFSWYFKSTKSISAFTAMRHFAELYSLGCFLSLIDLACDIPTCTHTACRAPRLSRGFLACLLTFSTLPTLSFLIHWVFPKEETCTHSDTMYFPVVQAGLTCSSVPASICLETLWFSLVFLRKHSI